jgi:LPS export ABC transporter protein LptC
MASINPPGRQAALRRAATALIGGALSFSRRSLAVLAGTVALLGGAAVLLGGCSLDYNPARLEEEIAAEVPDTVLTDFRHTIMSGDKVWVVLEARRAESYEKRKEVVLTEVRFREYDAEGELVSEALADRAVFHTDSENASADGAITIRSPREKASLSADSLVWTREGRILEADPQASVRLDKEDGSYVEGRGFRADFRRRRVEFAGRAQGRYVWEENDEK